jgi:hypothetical protein
MVLKGKVKKAQPQLQKQKKKATIPVAFREQIWIRTFGDQFKGKCPTPWCNNEINVFTFQSGHNIPESKGGPTIPSNLIPICSRCNQSMGDRYTFDEWAALSPSFPSAGPALPPVPVPVPFSQKQKRPWWLPCCS